VDGVVGARQQVTVSQCVLPRRKSQVVSSKCGAKERAMQIVLSKDSDVPLRKQLADQIVFLITTGQLQAGEALPSVCALGRQSKVHHNTVSEAYQDLVRSGGNIRSTRCWSSRASRSTWALPIWCFAIRLRSA
jgi:hypothetical protein